jgi:hypothetical protein
LFTNIVYQYCLPILFTNIVYQYCLLILFTNIVYQYCLLLFTVWITIQLFSLYFNSKKQNCKQKSAKDVHCNMWAMRLPIAPKTMDFLCLAQKSTNISLVRRHSSWHLATHKMLLRSHYIYPIIVRVRIIVLVKL